MLYVVATPIGDVSEISSQEEGAEAQSLPAIGEVKWKKGSVMVFASGSGGGWGIPKAATAADAD